MTSARDIKQMPLRMPQDVADAAKFAATRDGLSLNAWIVAAIKVRLGDAAAGPEVPGQSSLMDVLADDEPDAVVGGLAAAAVRSEAVASVALDRDQTHTVEHLHVGKATGGYEWDRGIRYALRVCASCGAPMPPRRA